MYLVDDVDAVLRRDGGERAVVAQLANVVNAVVGRGVYLCHIEDGLVVNAAADLALVARVAVDGAEAVDGLGKNFGAACLARSA